MFLSLTKLFLGPLRRASGQKGFRDLAVNLLYFLYKVTNKIGRWILWYYEISHLKRGLMRLQCTKVVVCQWSFWLMMKRFDGHDHELPSPKTLHSIKIWRIMFHLLYQCHLGHGVSNLLGPKKKSFGSKINCSIEPTKIGPNFRKKEFLNVFLQTLVSFFLLFNFIIFWCWKIALKVQFWHFLRPLLYFNSQKTAIKFHLTTVDFWQKPLPNSHTVLYIHQLQHRRIWTRLSRTTCVCSS